MKQRNASRGAECRHPVRQRHGALLAMYEAKATKQLSSAIVIASSRFALLFLGASSLSKTPAAAAVDHAAAALTPTERQGSVCGSMCREHSDCHRQRRPSWHRPSRASTHRAKHVLGSANTFLQSTVQLLMCVGVCWRSCKEEEHREAHQHSKRHSWMAAMHAVRPQPQQSRTVAAHTIHKKKKNEKKTKTRRQGVAVCVCGCGCLPALTAKKAKQEGKKCVLRPTGPRRTPTRHGSLSAPFVAAPPHACSRRGAQGRRHERVGGCASGAVGRETHGTPHRKSAEEAIKRGKSRKEKTSTLIAPKAKKKKRDRGRNKKQHNLITKNEKRILKPESSRH
ncbi:hypothetical protein ECC02_007630 [Trypanosoma cruzi]|uniref:Uncharacterized protein n=1 Tax=Trypanosoma cruzi TaxID=5693 RepID=A0A7J6XY04_TRYCR|nr:hypothetical protein ECC02_007630 [Trypanosoma cruzi]